MANEIRSLACAVACAGSIVGAGLGARSADGSYFVVLPGFLGFITFGLFTIRTVAGTANFARILEYLFSAETDEDGSS
jgi:hypothetical protein